VLILHQCALWFCCRRHFSFDTATVCTMVQMSAASPQSIPVLHIWTVALPMSSTNINPCLSNQVTLCSTDLLWKLPVPHSKNPHIFETQMFTVMLTTASHIQPVHILPFYCFNIHFTTQLSSIPVSSKRSLSIRFSNQIPG